MTKAQQKTGFNKHNITRSNFVNGWGFINLSKIPLTTNEKKLQKKLEKKWKKERKKKRKLAVNQPNQPVIDLSFDNENNHSLTPTNIKNVQIKNKREQEQKKTKIEDPNTPFNVPKFDKSYCSISSVQKNAHVPTNENVPDTIPTCDKTHNEISSIQKNPHISSNQLDLFTVPILDKSCSINSSIGKNPDVSTNELDESGQVKEERQSKNTLGGTLKPPPFGSSFSIPSTSRASTATSLPSGFTDSTQKKIPQNSVSVKRENHDEQHLSRSFSELDSSKNKNQIASTSTNISNFSRSTDVESESQMPSKQNKSPSKKRNRSKRKSMMRALLNKAEGGSSSEESDSDSDNDEEDHGGQDEKEKCNVKISKDNDKDGVKTPQMLPDQIRSTPIAKTSTSGNSLPSVNDDKATSPITQNQQLTQENKMTFTQRNTQVANNHPASSPQENKNPPQSGKDISRISLTTTRNNDNKSTVDCPKCHVSRNITDPESQTEQEEQNSCAFLEVLSPAEADFLKLQIGTASEFLAVDPNTWAKALFQSWNNPTPSSPPPPTPIFSTHIHDPNQTKNDKYNFSLDFCKGVVHSWILRANSCLEKETLKQRAADLVLAQTAHHDKSHAHDVFNEFYGIMDSSMILILKNRGILYKQQFLNTSLETLKEIYKTWLLLRVGKKVPESDKLENTLKEWKRLVRSSLSINSKTSTDTPKTSTSTPKSILHGTQENDEPLTRPNKSNCNDMMISLPQSSEQQKAQSQRVTPQMELTKPKQKEQTTRTEPTRPMRTQPQHIPQNTHFSTQMQAETNKQREPIMPPSQPPQNQKPKVQKSIGEDNLRREKMNSDEALNVNKKTNLKRSQEFLNSQNRRNYDALHMDFKIPKRTKGNTVFHSGSSNQQEESPMCTALERNQHNDGNKPKVNVYDSNSRDDQGLPLKNKLKSSGTQNDYWGISTNWKGWNISSNGTDGNNSSWGRKTFTRGFNDYASTETQSKHIKAEIEDQQNSRKRSYGENCNVVASEYFQTNTAKIVTSERKVPHNSGGGTALIEACEDSPKTATAQSNHLHTSWGRSTTTVGWNTLANDTATAKNPRRANWDKQSMAPKAKTWNQKKSPSPSVTKDFPANVPEGQKQNAQFVKPSERKMSPYSPFHGAGVNQEFAKNNQKYQKTGKKKKKNQKN